MTDPKTFDYSRLSVPERILLAQELWESVYENPDEIPVTDAQAREIRSRWAAHKSGHMTSSSWDEVRHRLLSR